MQLKKIVGGLLLLPILLSTGLPVFATEVQKDENVVVSVPMGEDFYGAGNNVQINNTVNGDVIVAGRAIEINAAVAEDLAVAGQEITVNANVGDDIRVAGQIIRINGNVAGDVIAFGQIIEIGKSAVIRGNLIASGQTITIAGTVMKDIKLSGESVNLQGTIDGDAAIMGKFLTLNTALTKSTKLQLEEFHAGERASLQDLQYSIKEPNDSLLALVKGKSEKLPEDEVIVDTERHEDEFSYVGFIWSYLALLLFAALLWYLGRDFFRKAKDNLLQNIPKASLIGFLGLIALPVAFVVLALSLVGIPLALIGMALYIFVMISYKAVIAVVVTPMIEDEMAKRKLVAIPPFLLLAGVLLLLKLIGEISYTGAPLFLLAIMAFGAIFAQLVSPIAQKVKK